MTNTWCFHSLFHSLVNQILCFDRAEVSLLNMLRTIIRLKSFVSSRINQFTCQLATQKVTTICFWLLEWLSIVFRKRWFLEAWLVVGWYAIISYGVVSCFNFECDFTFILNFTNDYTLIFSFPGSFEFVLRRPL